MTFPKVNEITLNIFRRTAQAVLLACAFAMLADGAIQAATLTVTKTADTNDGSCDQDCSLREAIAAANPAGGDEIVFASPLFDTPQTVSLSPVAGFQALLIDKNLTIRGRGANLLTVRRAPETPNTFRFRIFEIGTATVSISGLTVTGGNTAADAGGISGFGSTLTITDCHITGNVADGRGGGIRNVQGGSLTVINSTVSNNISNSASPGGGGIHSENGSLTITNSTVSGNVKTGGTNNGGGIAAFFSTVVVSNSTVTNNRADGANSAGGIYRQGNAATIRNTIIAANQNNNFTPDVFAVAPGTFTSDGFNLIGSAPSGTGFTDGVNQDKVGTFSSPLNPRLDALGNYGGTTPTHRLQSNSPALDQGHSGGSTRDQRGSFRPADNINIVNAANGDGSDIGAYEAEARLIVTSTADTPTGTCD
ncbi:MAG TPA: choice-of-anchor Q domain-containing protein, partial [Pyrinomonadaceae bacterium]|nr:choice-of-anchor Q domain-containing protein [Pyrinomonadaceae bacterium]